jgi:hypothetical protein
MGRSGHEVFGGQSTKSKARGSSHTGTGLTAAQNKALKTEYKKAAAAMEYGVSTAWGRAAVRAVRKQATAPHALNAHSASTRAPSRSVHPVYAVGAFAACFLFVVGLKPPARTIPTATPQASVAESVSASAEPVRVAISADTIAAERAPLLTASALESPGTQAARDGSSSLPLSAPLDIQTGLAVAAHSAARDVPTSMEPKYPVALAGVWGADPSACSARNLRGYLPTVIDADGARAGETFCRFTRKKQVEDGWDVVASCSNQRERWTSKVRLRLDGERLTSTSKRGSQSYVRCTPTVMMAEAVMR